MKTIKEMIAIMAAYDAGKTIQEGAPGNKIYPGWIDVKQPSWNWKDRDYRVKPESRYRPYENAQEFLAAQKLHGPMIFDPQCDNYHSVNVVYNNSISIHLDFVPLISDNIQFDLLLNSYNWQDGSKCGIKEE